MQVCALRQSTEYVTLKALVVTLRLIPQDCRNPGRLENKAAKFRQLTHSILSIIFTLPIHGKNVRQFTFNEQKAPYNREGHRSPQDLGC